MADTNDIGAWAQSALGNAIQAWTDRTANTPQIVHDASQQYGVAADGSLYMLGVPAQTTALAQNAQAMNLLPFLLVAGGVYLLLKKG